VLRVEIPITFRDSYLPLTAPDEVSVSQIIEYNSRIGVVNWNTAYAGDAPLKTYEIWRDGLR